MKESNFDKGINTLFSVIGIMVCMIVVYPLIYTTAVSLSSSSQILSNNVFLYPKEFTLSAYIKVFNMVNIQRGLKNSIIYTVVGTCINVVLTTALAYSLSRRHMIARKFLTVFLIIPLFINGGVVPTYLIIKWLDFTDTMWAVIMPFAILSYYLIIVKTFYEDIPDSIIESAQIEGENDIDIYIKIIIPMSVTIIATISLFYAISNWNNFSNALYYLNNSKKYPLSIVLKNMLVSTEMLSDTRETVNGELVLFEAVQSATIIIYVLPILLVYPFVQKYFKEGITMGSVKG
jgi:putative aldouronate transport system permease protein